MRSSRLLKGLVALTIATAFVVIGISTMAANPGNPAVFNAKASVNILKPLLISERTALSFGKIVGPIGADASNTYSASGTVGGTGGGSYISGAASGFLMVEGTAGETFSFVTTASGDCTDTKVVLSLNINWGGGKSLPSGSHGFIYGGSIKVTNAADGTGPLGVVTCPYTNTAVYE